MTLRKVIFVACLAATLALSGCAHNRARSHSTDAAEDTAVEARARIHLEELYTALERDVSRCIKRPGCKLEVTVPREEQHPEYTAEYMKALRRILPDVFGQQAARRIRIARIPVQRIQIVD